MQFLFKTNFFIKNLTIAKNFWQCLEQSRIQTVCLKIAVLFFFKWRICEFERYQKVILESSSPDSVAILEKIFGNIFSGFCMFFSKKKSTRKSRFWTNFTKNNKNWKQTENNCLKKYVENVTIPLLRQILHYFMLFYFI